MGIYSYVFSILIHIEWTHGVCIDQDIFYPSMDIKERFGLTHISLKRPISIYIYIYILYIYIYIYIY